MRVRSVTSSPVSATFDDVTGGCCTSYSALSMSVVVVSLYTDDTLPVVSITGDDAAADDDADDDEAGSYGLE